MTPTTPPPYLERELRLEAMASWPASRHVFEDDQIEALRAAEAAGRPLLVRGEPGTGKSQLAHAAAFATRRQFLPFVVDARTEATDLMWRFDAVARLADAHLASVPNSKIPEGLDAAAYVQPGPLWWAFDWNDAASHSKKSRLRDIEPPAPPFDWDPKNGAVLLIDEIDKAEAEVPNGLLEALGNGRFAVPALGRVVGMSGDVPRPLVVVTTNDERELPAAFLRRCLVLTLVMPEGDALIAYLRDRGRLHFPDFAQAYGGVLDEAARMLAQDRSEARDRGLYQPGLAEYLDLVRALERLGVDPLPALHRLRNYTFRKQPRL